MICTLKCLKCASISKLFWYGGLVDSQRNEQTCDKNKYIKYDPEWKCGCIGAHYTLSDFSCILGHFYNFGANTHILKSNRYFFRNLSYRCICTYL